MTTKTLDPANQVTLEVRERSGIAELGLMNNQVWHDDPKRLLFTLARYKFVAKMLEGKGQVLEVGCGDAFCARVVQQSVGELSAIDVEPLFVEDAKRRMDPDWPFSVALHDIMQAPYPGEFDAAYTLDVMEHIAAEEEGRFINHIKASLSSHGVLIAGMPSLESQAYASPASRIGHINCKSGNEFKALMEEHFENVFLFSMNDEVVHTGYSKMAHYLMALCCTPRHSG